MPQNGQDHYFIGGICVPIEKIPEIEQKVSALSERYFQSIDLIESNEFHASFLYRKKAHFDGMDVYKRIEIFEKLAEVLNDASILKVFSEIATERLKFPVDAGETAFMFFCERVELLMSDKKSHTILIGDQDDQTMKEIIQRFASYRHSKTYWQYGIKIESVVDTVHFARSHHCRMLQLADLYCFAVSHLYTNSRKGWFAEKVKSALKIEPMFHKYKEWPGLGG